MRDRRGDKRPPQPPPPRYEVSPVVLLVSFHRAGRCTDQSAGPHFSGAFVRPGLTGGPVLSTREGPGRGSSPVRGCRAGPSRGIRSSIVWGAMRTGAVLDGHLAAFHCRGFRAVWPASPSQNRFELGPWVALGRLTISVPATGQLMVPRWNPAFHQAALAMSSTVTPALGKWAGCRECNSCATAPPLALEEHREKPPPARWRCNLAFRIAEIRPPA